MRKEKSKMNDIMYNFIIERNDGEQRKVKASWNAATIGRALELHQVHGPGLEKEVEKFIGHEILEEIRRWEEE